MSTFGGPLPGGWKYHGGQLAADGRIYAVPANAPRVIRIDPRTSEVPCRLAVSVDEVFTFFDFVALQLQIQISYC